MSFASFTVSKLCNRLNSAAFLKLGLRLFDAMVAPIGLYGTEVLALENLSILEYAVRKFNKKLLALPFGAPNVGLELILGRQPRDRG